MPEQSFTLDPRTTKEERYQAFIPLFKSFTSESDEAVSTLANASAALKEAFGFFWVGFYLVRGDELVLGPFQGSPACTRIRKGRGVCGTAWSENRTIVVPDVDLFPGHIACSSRSRSEIVVPLLVDGKVAGVLDIDSDTPGSFDETDRRNLETIASIICDVLTCGGLP